MDKSFGYNDKTFLQLQQLINLFTAYPEEKFSFTQLLSYTKFSKAKLTTLLQYLLDKFILEKKDGKYQHNTALAEIAEKSTEELNKLREEIITILKSDMPVGAKTSILFDYYKNFAFKTYLFIIASFLSKNDEMSLIRYLKFQQLTIRQALDFLSKEDAEFFLRMLVIQFASETHSDSDIFNIIHRKKLDYLKKTCLPKSSSTSHSKASRQDPKETLI